MEQVVDKIELLSRQLATDPDNVTLLFERAKLYQQAGIFHHALNDFNRIVELQPENKEARTRIEMLNMIFEYRYTDQYNP